MWATEPTCERMLTNNWSSVIMASENSKCLHSGTFVHICQFNATEICQYGFQCTCSGQRAASPQLRRSSFGWNACISTTRLESNQSNYSRIGVANVYVPRIPHVFLVKNILGQSIRPYESEKAKLLGKIVGPEFSHYRTVKACMLSKL